MENLGENSIPLQGINPAELANNSAMTTPAVDAGLAIFLGMMVIFFLALALICYVFFAICLMKIAKKTETKNRWYAWIPILNVILMLQVAKKPLWWFFLFLIPPINIAIMIVVWMAIAKAVKKPDWLGILMLVPIANLVVPAYLAFSKMEEGGADKSVASTEPKEEK